MQKHDGEILCQCLTELELSKFEVCDVTVFVGFEKYNEQYNEPCGQKTCRSRVKKGY